MNAYLEAPKKGLSTEIDNKKLYEWGEIFLKLAKDGLVSRRKMNSKNKDETIYLLHTENVIKNRKNRAQLLLDKFEQANNLEFFNDEKEDFSYSGL